MLCPIKRRRKRTKRNPPPNLPHLQGRASPLSAPLLLSLPPAETTLTLIPKPPLIHLLPTARPPPRIPAVVAIVAIVRRAVSPASSRRHISSSAALPPVIVTVTGARKVASPTLATAAAALTRPPSSL
eukprot:scaffold53455_cov41-Cyclotella_meneghiniana.AAC.10